MHLGLLQEVVLILDDAHDLLSNCIVLLLYVSLMLRASIYLTDGLIIVASKYVSHWFVSLFSTIRCVGIELRLLIEPRQGIINGGHVLKLVAELLKTRGHPLSVYLRSTSSEYI